MTEQDRKEAAAIARREIARALRLLAVRWDAGDGHLRSFDLDDIAAALESPPAPDPRTVQEPNAIAVPSAAPSALPPLVGPDRPCLTWQDSAEHGSEWERIARAERDAREADIARLEHERNEAQSALKLMESLYENASRRLNGVHKALE